MKNTLLSAMFIAASLMATAQDNKPTKGDVGIWYGVSFVPVTQNVYITGYLTDHVEFGGTVGFTFNNHSNSQFSTVNIFTNSGFTDAQFEHQTGSRNISLSLSPMVLYHFNIKSNLDLGLGANLPISVYTGSRSTVSDITTTDNYYSKTDYVTTAPPSIGVGAGMLISCKYFFYKNLAIGAMGNLGLNTINVNGTVKETNSTTNSGSNNPGTGYNPTTTSENKYKANDQTLEFLHNFNLNLSWYFGSKKRAASTAAR
ncbi:MAG: hypothetical protein JSS76_10450 [Bacteroidetes bacterium]|nr:hypothetical protein [Bacteroidota bacterium]